MRPLLLLILLCGLGHAAHAQTPVPEHQLTQILMDHTLVGSAGDAGGSMQFLLYQAPDGTGTDLETVGEQPQLRAVRHWSVVGPGRFCLEREPLEGAAPETSCFDLMQYTTGMLVLHYQRDGADLSIPVQSLRGNKLQP